MGLSRCVCPAFSLIVFSCLLHRRMSLFCFSLWLLTRTTVFLGGIFLLFFSFDEMCDLDTRNSIVFMFFSYALVFIDRI